MTARVAGSVAAGTLRPQPLTDTPPASHLADAALISDSELITRTRQGDHRSAAILGRNRSGDYRDRPTD